MITAFQRNAFQDNAFQIDARTGGASYLTLEEMRELARQQRIIDKKRREEERAFEASIRETYEEIKNPGLKARIAKAAKDAADELEDEEALLTLILQHYETLH